jgi:hypothetical protein
VVKPTPHRSARGENLKRKDRAVQENHQKLQGYTVISEILRPLHENGRVTISSMADVLSRSSASVYRYLSGETDLEYGQVRALVKLTDNTALQEAILLDLTKGTGWYVAKVPAHLDVNGDGDVDLDDALQKAIETNQQTAAFLADALETSKRQRMTPADALRLRELTQRMLENTILIQQIVAFHAEAIEKRKIGGRA